jgi:hypothetical protein
VYVWYPAAADCKKKEKESKNETNKTLIDVDRDLTDDEREQIQALINKELHGQDLGVIHPMVDQVFPLPSRSKLIAEVPDKDLEDQEFTLGGIDIDHYSNLETDDAIQQSIAYTYLRQSSLKVHFKVGNDQWLINNDEQERLNEMVEQEVERKKRRINDINAERQRIQSEVKPVLDYLDERWIQGVQKNLELGIGMLQERYGL